MAGFDPEDTPSVGAFYLFIDRLEDGPYQPDYPHRVTSSQLRKLGQQLIERLFPLTMAAHERRKLALYLSVRWVKRALK